MKMASVAESWSEFWYKKESFPIMGIIRISVALLLIFSLTRFHPVHHLSMTIPLKTFPAREAYILNDVRLPVPGLEWLPAPSYEAFLFIENFILILALALAMGFASRLTAGLLAIVFAYRFFLSQVMYKHYHYLFAWVLLILAFSEGIKAFSVDSLINWRKSASNEDTILCRRLIQVLVTFVYFFSALHKAVNRSWWSGDMMRQLAPYSALIRWLSISWTGPAVILLEFLFCIGLWVPSWRKTTLWTCIIFHLAIDLSGIIKPDVYNLLMIVLLLSFFDDKSLSAGPGYHTRQTL